jgi:ribosomal protein L22
LKKSSAIAVANADQNADVDVDTWLIKNLIVDQGPNTEAFSRQSPWPGHPNFEKDQRI